MWPFQVARKSLKTSRHLVRNSSLQPTTLLFLGSFSLSLLSIISLPWGFDWVHYSPSYTEDPQLGKTQMDGRGPTIQCYRPTFRCSSGPVKSVQGRQADFFFFSKAQNELKLLFFLFKNIYLFSCITSQLQHVGSFFAVLPTFSSCGTWSRSAWAQYLQPAGLIALQHVGSQSLTKDQTFVLCIARWILSHWTTREVPQSTIGTSVDGL